MERPGPGGRLLKFLCVNDDGVRVKRDLGLDRNGEKTSQRQAIERILDEVVYLDGRKVAAFALAEPPTKAWPNDKLDDNVLCGRTGKWQLASEEWLAMRAKQVAQRNSEHEAQENKARMLASQNLASQLESLAARSGKAARQ